MKRYRYINDLGARKEIVVYPLENGVHPITIWCLENGELAGCGKMTSEQLENFLNHYNIKH